MSGFRVKSTHPLLQPDIPPQPQQSYSQSSLSLYGDEDDEKHNMLYTVETQKSVTDNRPKDSSTKGMAIRVVNGGQPDHM